MPVPQTPSKLLPSPCPLYRSGLRVAVLVLCTATSLAATSAAKDVAQLKWMAGCWEMRGGARVTHEHWMSPLGSVMLGMSRTVVRDTVREFEHLRIEVRGGVPSYVAMPSGQSETVFGATTVSDTMVVFANPAHDFPQRIIYRKAGADSMMARIEGPQGGQLRGIDLPMRRMPCGG